MTEQQPTARRPARARLHARQNSPWERRRAVRTSAHHAHDAVDLAELLDMLGLHAQEGR